MTAVTGGIEPLIQEAWDRQRRRRTRLLLVVVALAVATAFGVGYFDRGGTGTTSASQSLSSASRGRLVLKVDFTTMPQATLVEEARVAQMLRMDAAVSRYRFVSRGEALALMRAKEPALVRGLPYNPLPDSYEVSLKSPADVRSVARRLRSLPGVQVVIAGRLSSRS